MSIDAPLSAEGPFALKAAKRALSLLAMSDTGYDSCSKSLAVGQKAVKGPAQLRRDAVPAVEHCAPIIQKK